MTPQYTIRFGVGTGAAMYFALGFCPVKVRLTGTAAGNRTEWWITVPPNDGLETTDSTGARVLDASDGLALVKFSDPNDPENATITTLENAQWYEANGILIDDGVLTNTDAVPFILEAWGVDIPIIRAVHDGGDNANTYFQDSSVDFEKAGVSGGQSWIIINVTNDNYAYVKAVQKPAGQTKYCRLTTAEDSSGTATAAADFDDDDVCIVIPRQYAQRPLSGLGAMT
jgi:hypothetical protein